MHTCIFVKHMREHGQKQTIITRLIQKIWILITFKVNWPQNYPWLFRRLEVVGWISDFEWLTKLRTQLLSFSSHLWIFSAVIFLDLHFVKLKLMYFHMLHEFGVMLHVCFDSIVFTFVKPRDLDITTFLYSCISYDKLSN